MTAENGAENPIPLTKDFEQNRQTLTCWHNRIIEVSLIMGLVATFVGLYLRDLEIKNAQRDSQRYLMAKYSMTRAFRNAGFSLGIAVVLLLAVTPSAASTLFSDPPQVVSLRMNGTETVSFTSPDALGVSFVTHAVVTVTIGAATITVLKNSVTVSSASLAAPDSRTLDVEPTMWDALANWSLVFRNDANALTYVRFVLQKGLVSTLFSTVPFLLFLYGAAQLGWWVGLRPIRERTRASSLAAAPGSGPAARDGVQLRCGLTAPASAHRASSAPRPRRRHRGGDAPRGPTSRAQASRPSTGDARQSRDEGGRACDRERARCGPRCVRRGRAARSNVRARNPGPRDDVGAAGPPT